MPQIIISYLYLIFNGLFTCMLAGTRKQVFQSHFNTLTILTGKEWMWYAHHRSTLRVTSAKGVQRSIYWLQLSYTYSLPLLILSSLLSWLASQSLFPIQIGIVDLNRDILKERILSSCGYSPEAIILIMVVGSMIVLGTFATAARRYPPGIPLASTYSAAISAACHRPPDDVDASVLPVQWGVVSTKNGIGHCSFSSRLVGPPIPGRTYEW